MMKNHLFGIICFSTLLFSCNEKQEAEYSRSKIKKTIGIINNDSIAPPIVIPFTNEGVRLSPVITSKPYTLDENMGKETVTSFSSEAGLPFGTYYQIEQDDHGNLWMNTGYELVKYDGHSFHSYKPPSTNYYIQTIAVDKQNNIWSRVFDNVTDVDSIGLNFFVFDGKSFQQIPGLQSRKIGANARFTYSLFRGADKRIWVLDNKQKQIKVYDGQQLVKTIESNEFPFKSISSIGFAYNNIVWFNDPGDSSLTKYDGTQFKTYTQKDGLPKTAIWSITPGLGDSLFLNTDRGLFLFKDGKASQILTNTRGSAISDQGNVWANHGGGFNVLKLTPSGNIEFIQADGIETPPSIINKDNQDNIWVGAISNVYRLYRPVSTFPEIFPRTKDDRARPFFQDRAGNYWFGSFKAGISRYDGNLITNYSFVQGSSENYGTKNNIESFVQDKQNNIWISTQRGNLIKFDGSNFTEFNKPLEEGTNNSAFKDLFGYHFLFADSKDNIWFSKTDKTFVGSQGVGYFDGSQLVYYTSAQGLPHNYVYCTYEDSKGIMWFGTANGLSRFDGKRFTNYGEKDGLPDDNVQRICEDDYGHLWIATENGLSRFDGHKFINYTKEDGLTSESISSIKKSVDKKLIWLQTAAGITAMHLHTADSVTFQNLNQSNGFPIKASQFFEDRDGTLWTSENDNSLKRIDYHKIKANAKPFNIHLSNIRINNISLCWSTLLPDDKADSLAKVVEMQHRFGKALNAETLASMKQQFGEVQFDSIIPFEFIPHNLVLPYATNAISFEFATIDPIFSSYSRYQYMLEGFDRTWSPLSRNTNANFGKLSEGIYTFRVKAINTYGIWSEMNYSFKVLPPWYRTWWAYTIYALLFLGALRMFSLWRERRLRHEKEQLQVKVEERTVELKKSLEDLKSTQSQLIQSEKMASLGELTAGIAHEIQNPLNFVNNFSEVSIDIAKELKEEIEKLEIPEKDKEYVNEIIGDLSSNQEKINHHGKRASSIVKGMLEHSRTSSGKKEPTDINALADEYLKLAYQSLRAKDKDFNAILETDFDTTLPKINVVSQDIGRVILNLITNAFYAVNERSKKAESNYVPTVSITTQLIANSQLLIAVKDNGSGIPANIKDKIFQPFFTTKPTGQGTGLGLSLAYDIVKAHGGELRVKTREGEGSEFIIIIMFSKNSRI